MSSAYINKCIECGKQRVVVESHTENVGNGTIVYSETTCPDPDCQKRVDLTLLRELQKRQESMKTNRLRGNRKKVVNVDQKASTISKV